jgi:glycosyltransferase involved in cell wall biosynthesis
MRIAYIWSRPIPSRETDTPQVLKTVDALAAEGADIDLVVPYSYAMLRSGMDAFEARLRDFYGLRHGFRLKPIVGVEPSRFELERPVHAVMSCARNFFYDYDVVYSRSRMTTVLCAITGQKAVFETYRALGTDNPGLVRLLTRCAKSKAFLGIVTHSNIALRSIAAAGFPSEKLSTVHNGFDPRDMEPRLTKNEARAALGLDAERPLVVYTGHLRANKGMHAIVDAAALIPEVLFLLVGGDPKNVDALKKECASRNLSNVQCLGWHPAASLPRFMYAADALIIPPSVRPLQHYGRTVLPMKIFAYLAAGRPIVAPSLEDLQEVLSDEINALLVPPDEPDTTAAVLRRVITDRQLAERLSAQAIETSRKYSWQSRARKVIDQIDRWSTNQ